MVYVPDSQHTTAQKVADWYAGKTEEQRPHLGASAIGHSCDRYLWLTFRWAAKPNFDYRVKRLFDTGKREEARVYDELRAVGVELHTDEKGQQITCRDDTGHFGGSVDGIGCGFIEAQKTWAVLEIKTHNAKSFGDLEKKGVMESKPRHYAQMQVYMGLMKLERALYYAVNKNTDDIYTEWVKFDSNAFNSLKDRAQRIIKMKQAPGKLSEDPAHWECKFCDFYNHCHQDDVAAVNCRTCVHSTPAANGKWNCEEHKNELGMPRQRAGCDDHIFIPGCIPWAEIVDAGEGWIEYTNKASGRPFKNGRGHYKSAEISMARAHTVASEAVDAVKEQFPNSTIVAVHKGGYKRKKAPEVIDGVPPEAEPFLNDEIPF